MGEKGGKGFSVPNSSLKSTLAKEVLKGKDDSFIKAKKQRNVNFDSDDSPEAKLTFSSKSGQGLDMKTGKGDWSNGGKEGKIANGKKSFVSKEPEPLELRTEWDLPNNAKCLMDCEAAEILQGIQEQMAILSEDPTIKIPVSYDRGLKLSKIRHQYTDPKAVRQVLETVTKYDVSDGEAKGTKLMEPLKDVLSKLVNLKLKQ